MLLNNSLIQIHIIIVLATSEHFFFIYLYYYKIPCLLNN